jgi:adenosylcobinamide-GDP ribazoletransferase
VKGFTVALQFLTRLPLRLRRPIRPEEMGASMGWFPVVGALLGAIVAIVDFGLGSVWSPEVRSVTAVALLAALTGGLHLDGLMDSCDGLLAFTSPQRRLEIMGDSRVGSFAIVGAATVLLLKYAAILSLPADSRAASLVAMGALSRWSMVYATVRYPVARSSGLAYTFKATAGLPQLAMASVAAAVVALPMGLAGLGAMLAAWLVTVALARYAMAKIPGLTGDVYGAISEAVEVGVAVVLPPLGRLLDGW